MATLLDSMPPDKRTKSCASPERTFAAAWPCYRTGKGYSTTSLAFWSCLVGLVPALELAASKSQARTEQLASRTDATLPQPKTFKALLAFSIPSGTEKALRGGLDATVLNGVPGGKRGGDSGAQAALKGAQFLCFCRWRHPEATAAPAAEAWLGRSPRILGIAACGYHAWATKAVP
jgi:hypothetical protein